MIRIRPWIPVLALCLFGLVLGLVPGRDPEPGLAGMRQDRSSSAAEAPLQSAGEGPLAYELAATWPLPARGFVPRDVALSPDGHLFLADEAWGRVEVFAPDGRYVGFWPAPPPDGIRPMVPHRVAVDPSGQRVFVIWDGRDPWFEVRRPDGAVVHPARTLDLVGVTDIDATSADELMLLSQGSLVRIAVADLRVLSEHHAGTEARNLARRLAALPDDGAALILAEDHRSRLERYDAQASLLSSQVFTEDLAVDLASLADGSVRVHFGRSIDSDAPQDPARVVLRDFAPDGSPRGLLRGRDLPDVHSPVDPSVLSRWFFDAHSDGFALSTAGPSAPRNYRLLRYDDSNRPLQLHESWLGFGEDQARAGLPGQWSMPALPLAWTPAGLHVLDGRGWQPQLQRFGPDGRVQTLATGPAPSGADLAAAADGSFVLASPEGGLTRVEADGGSSSMLSTDCDCDLGGRVAVGSGASEDLIFVSRPLSSTIALIDARLDDELTRFRLPDALGLWPADLAALPGGDLLSADTASGEVLRWRPDGAISMAWQEPTGRGILRIATTRLTDSRELAAGLRATGEVVLHDLAGGMLSRFDPLDAPGVSGPIDDLALDDRGRIYLSDAGAQALLVFEPAAAIPTPPPAPSPAPTDPASCQIEHDKRAGPSRVLLGDTAQVTLTLRASCRNTGDYEGADVVMAFDRGFHAGPRHRCYRSAGDAPPAEGIEVGRLIGERVLRRLDLRHHRAGALTQIPSGLQRLPLGSPLADLLPIWGLPNNLQNDHPDLGELLQEADRMLLEKGRPDALPVLVLLSAGCTVMGPDDDRESIRAYAADMRARGVLIYVVRLYARYIDFRQPVIDLLSDLAGSPDRYVLASRPSDGDPIAQEINRLITELAGSSLAGNLLIQDRMSPDVQLLPGSARPEALEGPDWLSWRRGLLPSTGLTMTYEILPLRTGILPTNALAEAHFTDVDGSPRTVVFPVPEIEVVAPTATPTLTPPSTTTPSGPPTTGPSTVYLPQLFKQACLRDARRLDVALVVDRSQSMLEPTREGRSKLEAAREAVAAFVELLDMRSDASADRAALVAFDAEAELILRFTGEAAAVREGLSRIESRAGTRIDLGLDVAHAELTRIGASARRERVLVLLTDGRVSPDLVPLVEASARRIRSDGIRLITVGLGQDADAPLLARIASGAEDHLLAPDGEDLAGIYRRLASRIACQP